MSKQEKKVVKKETDTLLIIRGLLAVAVVVWHIVQSNTNIPACINIPGRTAVWIFFGISGYVITYGFLTKRYSLQINDIKAFYRNRFLRIYPLFLLISILTLVTAYFVSGKSPISMADIPAQLFMLQFNHEYILSGVFWTLGIEVQFYLVAPLLVILFLNTQKNAYWIIGAVYVLFVTWVPFAFHFFGWSFDGRNLISNLSHFLIGMIGCKWVLEKKPLQLNKYILIGILLVLVFLTNYLYREAIKFYWTLGSVLIDLIILLSILLHANLSKQNANEENWFLRAFTFLGVISYGVYAWHPYLIKYIPMLDQLVPLAVAVTILVAYISFRFVEQPILKMKRIHKTGTVS